MGRFVGEVGESERDEGGREEMKSFWGGEWTGRLRGRMWK